ncbi:hypothetical protein MIMGU_mgv1a018492mg, partial [Erythranthe guttata]
LADFQKIFIDGKSLAPTVDDNSERKLSKKEPAKHERQKAAASAAAAVSAFALEGDEDPLRTNYGDITLKEFASSKPISGKKKRTLVQDLNDGLKGNMVVVRGRAQAIRAVGKKMAFLVVRRRGCTVQCVLTVSQDLVSSQMVKFATSLSRESIIEIEGLVSVPAQPITGATQQVEIQVRKLYCVDRAVPTLPFNFDDAARSEADIEKALQAGEQLVRVNQGTRLNYRFLDIPLISEFSAFSIKFRNNRISLVPTIFCHFLESEDFFGIHTPKTLAGSSEGGSAVFRLDYKGTSACLAQSPQLHKQLSIVSDFDRVFEIGPEAGVEVDPLGDLSTETERKLGQLILEKYDTEFYILYCYPLSVRPFYTMPSHDGEEIISGGQRVHVADLLREHAQACGIDVTSKTIATYIDSFRYGTAPHGGFGVGLERVVMLFCAPNNIRKTSLFPRDPQRIVP